MFGRGARSLTVLLLLTVLCVHFRGCYEHGHAPDDGHDHSHDLDHDFDDDDEPHPPSFSPDDVEDAEDGAELPADEQEGEVGEVAKDNANANTEASNKTVDEDGYEWEDDVAILNDNNFQAFIDKHQAVFVKFYTPWCSFCKKLAPKYIVVARKVKKHLPLAKINCDENKEIPKNYKLKGYPTLKLFRKNKSPIDYESEHNVNKIVEWLKPRTDPNYKPPPPVVVKLTTETFDSFIADKPVVLVKFYTTDECNKCLMLEPQFDKAAKQLKEEHDIPLAKVNCKTETKLAEQYGITKYPTLLIFRHGRRFDYTGPEDSYGIVYHVVEQKQQAATHLTTLKNAKDFQLEDDVTIIGFFAFESGTLYDALIDASEKTRTDYKAVGYVTDLSLRQQLKIDGSADTVVLYQPKRFWSEYEPKYYRYEKQSATVEELIAFWRSHSTPLLGQKTRKNAATRYTHFPLVVIYYNVDFLQHNSGTQFWRYRLLKIANKYKNDNYKFAIADEDEFSTELTELGLGDSGLEHNVVVFGVDGKKYPMKDDVYDDDNIVENLQNFLSDISKGKAKPHVKSAPVPKGDDGPVTRVVASNFDSIVNDPTKDVLIEFYAPWCGHCKKFEPKYKQFAAKHQAEQPNFVVAKFDGVANDPPANYPVKGYPTIYFSPSGEKGKPIKYEGNRELSDLEAFVKKHATASFKEKSADAEKPVVNDKKADEDEL